MSCNNLQHKALSAKAVKQADGRLQISFTVESQGAEGCSQVYGDRDRTPEKAYRFDQGRHALGEDDLKFTTNQVYTVYPDGSIELQSAISSNRANVLLPRLGYAMKLPSAFSKYYYYGRGPINNYNDRKTGQFIELHESTVAEQGIMLPKPQAQGNREEVRWCALTNERGQGVAFVADGLMSASALPYSQQELTVAPHPYQLPASSGTHLHLDVKVTGLGGASCGQGGPLADDRTMANNPSAWSAAASAKSPSPLLPRTAPSCMRSTERRRENPTPNPSTSAPAAR